MSCRLRYKLIAAALVLLLHCAAEAAWPNFNQFPECNYGPLPGGHNSLPKFTHEFQLRTKVKWADTYDDFFVGDFEFTGYYQLNGSRGATIITSDGMEWRFLFDYETGVACDIYSPRSSIYHCSPVPNLYDSVCAPLVFYIAGNAGYEKIYDKCHVRALPITQVVPTMLNGSNLPITVRGIPVFKFKQCIWMAPTAAESAAASLSPPGSKNAHSVTAGYWLMEYFYSRTDNMSTASSRQWLHSTEPVRLIATRLGASGLIYTAHQRALNGHKPLRLYDFVSYRTQITDKTVFDPPPGVHCVGWTRAGNKTLLPPSAR